jgi:hypothetical protein
MITLFLIFALWFNEFAAFDLILTSAPAPAIPHPCGATPSFQALCATYCTNAASHASVFGPFCSMCRQQLCTILSQKAPDMTK